MADPDPDRHSLVVGDHPCLYPTPSRVPLCGSNNGPPVLSRGSHGWTSTSLPHVRVVSLWSCGEATSSVCDPLLSRGRVHGRGLAARRAAKVDMVSHSSGKAIVALNSAENTHVMIPGTPRICAKA